MFLPILDGTVWTMGANKYGTLGRNGVIDSPKLAPVEGLPAIEEIYVGWYHCVVRAKNNQVCIISRLNFSFDKLKYGGFFGIKMSYYLSRTSIDKNETVSRRFYVYNGNPTHLEILSLY